jgi:hypothetical protein
MKWIPGSIWNALDRQSSVLRVTADADGERDVSRNPHARPLRVTPRRSVLC